MRLGASLFLIAVGAILKFAVTKRVSGIDLSTVGVILMIIGAVGLLLTMILMTARRRTDVVVHDRGTTLIAPNNAVDPIDPRY